MALSDGSVHLINLSMTGTVSLSNLNLKVVPVMRLMVLQTLPIDRLWHEGSDSLYDLSHMHPIKIETFMSDSCRGFNRMHVEVVRLSQPHASRTHSFFHGILDPPPVTKTERRMDSRKKG